jgi:UDP-N-acetylglucosamine--N-acetylmuramyl-(pentapeptide) pyrophosphoryl-undecaprenol N-acetylglucosamine transferase
MNKQKLKRVLIMAGGTGGHVFPGLALASYLRSQDIEVHWLGTAQGIEARLVPAAQIPLHLISVEGIRGKGFKTLLSAPFKITKAVLQARNHIKKIAPDVVVGMGGFVSGPGGLASWLVRCPLVIHEQNAKAGMTNKILANLAKSVMEGFPSAFPGRRKVIVTGNPVRAEIEAMPPPDDRLNPVRGSFRLLVIGGSLGAHALNTIVPRALIGLSADLRPEIWHQTGSKHFDNVKNDYKSAGIEANLTPFIEDMAQAYQWADMVLCRAGALTVAELCTAGLGAVFVPYPYAVDDHQTANASYMVKHNAAVCVQESELSPARLAEMMTDFANAPEKRMAMARAAYKLRKVDVVQRIFDILCKVAN